MRLIVAVFLLLIAAPPLAVAQTSQFDGEIRAAAALQLAARSVPGSPAPSYLAGDALALRRRSQKQTGVTLMLIGGGAVLVGALAGGSGGTVLIVGGVVCAGYGFYLYTERRLSQRAVLPRPQPGRGAHLPPGREPRAARRGV